jgi:hypothetical protein
MRLRPSSLVVAGALAGFALSLPNCYRPDSYACQSDADCVLAAGDGICTDLGHCAYVSDLCESGWKYPDGVPGALGGKCAVGPPPPSDTDDTDPSTTTTDPSTTLDTSTTSTTTGTDTDRITATGTGTSSGGNIDTDTDGPVLCEDPDAPDDAEDAQLLSLPACALGLINATDKEGDIDWYHLQFPPSCVDFVRGRLSGSDGRHCLYVGCVAMDLCVSGGSPDATLLQLGYTGCCRDSIGPGGDIVIDTGQCPADAPLYAMVEPYGNMCEPYVFDIDASD